MFKNGCVFVEPRLPYYMAYPMPLLYDDTRMERLDLDYMKSMYPTAVKRILPYVEDECERMMYTGSMIYDEYPDQLQIRMMANRIFENMKKNEKTIEQDDNTIKDIIQILLFHEIFQRRCQYRRDRRKYY